MAFSNNFLIDTSPLLYDEKIPSYFKNPEQVKRDLLDLKDALQKFQSYNCVAIGEIALWLHGFTDKRVYQYLYNKDLFKLPDISLFVYNTESAVHVSENPPIVAYDLECSHTKAPIDWYHAYRLAIYDHVSIMGIDTLSLSLLLIVTKKFVDRQFIEDLQMHSKCMIF